MLSESGPLLLACNHPNSFLDAVVLDTLFNQPIWSLARGDVFKNSFISKLLRSLKILPVYRVSEGVENLSSNYETFEDCKNLFRENGIVLIFSEGKCINEWHLRKLKKGTARLAISSWQDHSSLRVLPVGLNYSSFTRFGKNIFINFGEIIERKDIPIDAPDGLRIQSFNMQLDHQLKELVYEIGKTDKAKQKKLLEKKPEPLTISLLSLPAFVGFLLHFPLYLPLKWFTWTKTRTNDHYDSVLTGLLIFTYPIYLLLISILAYAWLKSFYIILIPLSFPLLAWSYVQVKPQLDK